MCTKLLAEPKLKNKLSLDEKGDIRNPFKGVGFGLGGKAVAKICQQLRW